MSRTSRNTEINKSKNVWNCALYLRLSRDDDERTKESDSIANQKLILTSYIDEKQDELKLYDIYTDDGWSGTNFDRPDFKRMMNDIHNGYVNCVIVKNQSRFGRDYIDVGNYFEKIFPKLGVRFISLYDGLDSAVKKNGVDYVTPIKSVIDDKYAENVSIQVRQTFEAKAKNGQFIGAFASYGYKKHPDNKNKLIIDEEVAWVVQRIYKLYLDGCGKIDIAKKLNSGFPDEGILPIPCPSEYKKISGMKYKNSNRLETTSYWTYSTVHKILNNEMYIGNMVQGKSQTTSYKVKQKKQQDFDKWIIVEGTHEPIIDIDTWNKTQNLLKRDVKKPKLSNNVHLFAGFLKCGDCGRAMHHNNSGYRKKSGEWVDWKNYMCGTYMIYGSKSGLCTRHTIRVDELYNAVLSDINLMGKLVLSIDKIAEINNAKEDNKIKRKSFNIEIEKLEKERLKYNNLKTEAYMDWKSQSISQNDYNNFIQKFDNEILRMEKRLEQLRDNRNIENNKIDTHNVWFNKFKEYGKIKEINRSILADLISNIQIYEGKRIKITYNYMSEFVEMLLQVLTPEHINNLDVEEDIKIQLINTATVGCSNISTENLPLWFAVISQILLKISMLNKLKGVRAIG